MTVARVKNNSSSTRWLRAVGANGGIRVWRKTADENHGQSTANNGIVQTRYPALLPFLHGKDERRPVTQVPVTLDRSATQ